MKQIFTLILAYFLAFPAHAAEPIKIGDIAPYTGLAQYAEPYKKGWELALAEINGSGGVLGRPLEIISRDSRGNPSDAVTVAQELIHAENVFALMGPMFSHVGLAVSEISKREKIPLVTAIAGTDKLLWEEGHPYVFRIYNGTYALASMLSAEAAKLPAQRWGIIAENYEAGHAYADAFREHLSRLRPDVEFVMEQWPSLNRINAGAVVQAVKKDKPDALFVFLLGGNMSAFVRESRLRGIDDIPVVNPSLGFPEERGKFGAELPEGWIVLGLPGREDGDPPYQVFYDKYEDIYGEEPGFNSVLGYLALKSIALAIEKAGTLDCEAFIKAMNDIRFDFINGSFYFRKIDNQSTFVHTVGVTAVIDGEPTMTDTVLQSPGDHFPPDEYVLERKGRK
ncbi:MAG: ABC transporter substrate-binding protein [Alphaproteobacteria bacterium]|nr:ABC transporter substrate-binding protein [Alphaproteobacteria bacterium]